jgi:hypothetical protein
MVTYGEAAREPKTAERPAAVGRAGQHSESAASAFVWCPWLAPSSMSLRRAELRSLPERSRPRTSR